MSGPADRDGLAAMLCGLLRESLADWRVDGTVELSEEGCNVLLRSGAMCLAISPSGPDGPGRWTVRQAVAGDFHLTRPCASVTGVLTLVQRLVGAEPIEARPLRIGAATAPR